MKSACALWIHERRALLRWMLWFGLCNSVILWVVASHYLSMLLPIDLPRPSYAGDIFVLVYIAMTYFSFFALWACLPLFVILCPFMTITRRVLYFKVGAVLISSLIVMLVLIDSHIFVLYRFHINATLIHMAFSGHFIKFFALSWLEWGSVLGFIVMLVLIESVLAKGLWSFLSKHTIPFYEKPIIWILASCLLLSYVIFINSVVWRINAFSLRAKVFPYYTQMVALLFPAKHALKGIERFDEGYFSQLHQINARLHYPLHPLVGDVQAKDDNIVMIVIDAWRFDALTQHITPHLAQFAQHAWQFRRHFSGGNGTQAGLFSLFYSLPESYWDAMLQQKVAPVLMQTLQQHDYQMGIYASAPLTIPRFNATIFKDVPDLQTNTPGDTVGQRDRAITQAWLHFLKQRDTTRPFFGFLFYDAAHSYCLKQDFEQIFQPAIRHCYRLNLSNQTDPIPYKNRYNNAMHFIDHEIYQVLQGLKQRKLLDHTIVIITGDHGQEFNDNHRNYWEHAGNFTRYQVQTPLIVYWPHQAAHVYTHMTTHYDIVPTLLHRVLGIQNPMTDYSIGYDLLDQRTRFPMIMGSYINAGIRFGDTLTILYPSGTFQVEDLHAKPLSISPTVQVVEYAMHVDAAILPKRLLTLKDKDFRG